MTIFDNTTTSGINITGTSGTTYNLDHIVLSDTRTDSTTDLIVQVWLWNPASSNADRKLPNPPSPEIGQIWLSKLVTIEELATYLTALEAESTSE